MLAQKDSYIESAYEHLQTISRDKEKRLEYEARQKAIWDYNQMMLEAEERGREQGEEKIQRINKLNALLMLVMIDGIMVQHIILFKLRRVI